MGWKAKCAAVCLTVASVIGVTGCDSGSGTQKIKIAEPNLRNWTLPLDEYRVPPANLLGYASDLIRRDCLKKSGYDYPVIPYNESAPGNPVRNSVGRWIFNQDLAAKYGYHEGPTQKFSLKAMQERQEPAALGYQEAADKCEQEVVKAGLDWSQINDDTAGKIALSVKPDSSALKDATAKWQECMAPLKLPGQPRDPEEMPGDILSQRFDLDHAVEWNAKPPTSEEIRVAIADAKCRDSSGYRKALYQAEYAAQKVAVEGHASELAPLLSRNKKLLEVARKIIKERG